MADNNNESGSRDRATVALVDAKIDGLRDLLRAETGHIKERLEPLASLTAEVTSLRTAVDGHEHRLESLETSRSGDRDYRRVHLPTLVLAGVVAAGSIINTILQHVH